jgi:CBS domain-containing protein
MVANLLSLVISRRFQRVPVYEALLQQDEIHIPVSTVRESGGWTARDVMEPPTAFLSGDMSIDAARSVAGSGDRYAYLVGSNDRLLGVVTTQQLMDASEAGRGHEALGAYVNSSFVHVHDDHPIDVVLARLSQSPALLPVVDRAAARRVYGVITVDSLTRLVDRRPTVTRDARQDPRLSDDVPARSVLLDDADDDQQERQQSRQVE